MLRAVEVMLTSSALTPAPGEAAFKSVGSHTSERDGLMIPLGLRAPPLRFLLLGGATADAYARRWKEGEVGVGPKPQPPPL